MPSCLHPEDRGYERAVARLRSGEPVVVPTETVYGLAALTLNEAGLKRVFELKGRPFDNPLIAHVLDAAMARSIVADWDERAQRLADRFWPGPLTLVLQRASHVPAIATAGWETIAVRAPSHPVASRLLQRLNEPFSAPSANRSGHVSPTRANHVLDDYTDQPDLLVLDGGPCEIGIESTVLDLTGQPPRVLRPGHITAQMLREVIGEVDDAPVSRQAASPGTGARHYAPHTPTRLVLHDDLLRELVDADSAKVVVCHSPIDVQEPHDVIRLPESADAYAAALYDVLRKADAGGFSEILIEVPPDDPAWQAVRDRLRRASAMR